MAQDKKKSQVDQPETVIAALFDSQDNSTYKARRKPYRLDYKMIRKLSYINPLIAVVVLTLKHTVTRIPGYFAIKEEYQDKNLNLEKEIQFLEALKTRPNEQENNREFWLKIYEDILVIDRGCVELVRNNRGDIVEMYPVDGATIKPKVDKYGNFDEREAYVQMVEDYSKKPVATFSPEELILMINNPMAEVNSFGYGMSPIERIAQTVTTYISAENYNTGQFTSKQLPPFLANIPNAPKIEIDKLNASFAQNAGNQFKGMFTNAQDLKVEVFDKNMRDMQFYELIQWYAHIIVAAYGLSPQDIGLTGDVNRATAEVQQNISKSQAISDLLQIRKEFWDRIIYYQALNNPDFMYIEYVNEPIDKLDEKTQAEIDKLHSEIVMTFSSLGLELPESLRDRMGYANLQTTREETNESETNSEKNIEKSKLEDWYSF